MSVNASAGVAAMESHCETQAARNVLVVSYYFPPFGDVGVHRTLRFIKWLPTFGWQPIVLTTENGKAQKLDETLQEKVPSGVPVHRTRSFELLNYGTPIDGRRSRRLPSLVSKFAREVPRDVWRYLAVPDGRIGWVPYATAAGRRIAESRPLAAVYVSGKPFSSYFIGEALSKKLRVPWIMDLRDLWTLNRRHRTTRPLRKLLERRLERRFVRGAAQVIVNTPDNRNDFIAAYPECDPQKFVTITNGYDEGDFAGLSHEPYDKFTVGYSGAFYAARGAKSSLYRRLLGLNMRRSEVFETYSPDYLFAALAMLFQQRSDLCDKIQVMMTGPGCDKAMPLVQHYDLADNVHLRGWLSYRDSLEMLCRADVNALMLSRGEESRGWIPSKLYQYLGAGSPVLAMVPDGDAAQIIRETQSGEVVRPDDAASIKECILRMYERSSTANCYEPKWSDIERYEGAHLTRRLADCLDEAARARVV